MMGEVDVAVDRGAQRQRREETRTEDEGHVPSNMGQTQIEPHRCPRRSRALPTPTLKKHLHHVWAMEGGPCPASS
eukprot:scaffold28541_cov30-Tisochrysis_lutea.AAC.2